jgi:outer membrane protein, heavy metal efflux system
MTRRLTPAGRRRLRLLSLVILTVPEPLAAAAPRALSLAAARKEAAEHNWTVAAAGSGVQLAEGLHLQSHAWPNPSLSLSAAKLNLTEPGPSGSTSDTTVALSELVELGSKRASRIRAATAALAAARGELASTRVVQDAALVKAYAAAVAAAEAARVSRESAESLRHAASIADVRFRAGEISAAERDQTRVAAGRFDADVRSAEAGAAEARIALQVLLGEPSPDGELDLTDDLDALARLSVASAPATAPAAHDAVALDNRGDVQAARAASDQAAAQLELQKAQRVPDLLLSTQYESDRPDNPQTLGFGVSITLPLFDRSKGAIAAAQAASEQAAREAARVRAQANAELAAARAALAAALDKHRSYRDELLPTADSVRQTVAFSYEKGLASLLELLEAERSLNEVRLAAVASEADAVNAAVDLAAARGETIP